MARWLCHLLWQTFATTADALTHIYPYFQNKTDVCLVPEIQDTVFYGFCWYLLLPPCVNDCWHIFTTHTSRQMSVLFRKYEILSFMAFVDIYCCHPVLMFCSNHFTIKLIVSSSLSSRHFLATAVHHNGWLSHRRIRELSSLMAGCDKDILVSGNKEKFLWERVRFVGMGGALVVLLVWRVWSIPSDLLLIQQQPKLFLARRVS